MTPPTAVLENTEVFEAFKKAGGNTLRISAPGYPTLTVIAETPSRLDEEPLSESDVASILQGIADIENGDYMDADEFLAQIRAEYGLQD